MAGKAFRRGAGEIAVRMALVAVIYGVAQGQREEIVVDPASGPGDAVHGMAIQAVCRIPCFCMVRCGCSQVIIAVAVVAFHSKGVKP
ncbi:MAG: hypothetical protein MZV63_60390 [Marinilabiliales bacterium]|nr:hypothetical protein [Marinilabiliales bacterium]